MVIAGNGIAVAVATGGNGAKEYTVSLTPLNVNKLANMTNTNLVAGSNITLGSSSTVVGDINTVSYVVGAVNTFVPTQLVRARISINQSNVPTISIVSNAQYGSQFTTPSQGGGSDFITNENASNLNDWETSLTEFTIANFGTPGANFYPEVKIANLVGSVKGTSISWANRVTADIVAMATNQFTIRFSDENGNNVTGVVFQKEITSIDLIFKIQA